MRLRNNKQKAVVPRRLFARCCRFPAVQFYPSFLSPPYSWRWCQPELYYIVALCVILLSFVYHHFMSDTTVVHVCVSLCDSFMLLCFLFSTRLWWTKMNIYSVTRSGIAS